MATNPSGPSDDVWKALRPRRDEAADDIEQSRVRERIPPPDAFLTGIPRIAW